MPSLEALEERAAPFSEVVARYVKASPDMLDGIRRGVAEVREGKTRLWKDIRRELRLG